MQTRAKRARLRWRKPRFAGKAIRSEFRARPVVPEPKQPYLSTDINIAELLKNR